MNYYNDFENQIQMQQEYLHRQQQYLNNLMAQYKQQANPAVVSNTQSQTQTNEITNCIPVTSYREVEAQRINPIGKTLFTNFKNGKIYNAFIDLNGNKVIETYSLAPTESEEESENTFVTRNDINGLINYVNGLETKLSELQEAIYNGAKYNDATYSVESTDTSNVSTTKQKSKSNARPTTNDESKLSTNETTV